MKRALLCFAARVLTVFVISSGLTLYIYSLHQELGLGLRREMEVAGVPDRYVVIPSAVGDEPGLLEGEPRAQKG